MLLAVSIAAVRAFGCGPNAEYRSVDFLQTIDIAQPQPQPEQSRRLRGAIAAMISPKETHGYYQALLGYIGRRLGYDIQQVQRRTYSEINALFPKR